jgi:hypothetical protein
MVPGPWSQHSSGRPPPSHELVPLGGLLEQLRSEVEAVQSHRDPLSEELRVKRERLELVQTAVERLQEGQRSQHQEQSCGRVRGHACHRARALDPMGLATQSLTTLHNMKDCHRASEGVGSCPPSQEDRPADKTQATRGGDPRSAPSCQAQVG